MNFASVLRACGPDIWSSRIKLVRHADARWDLERVSREGFLDDYERIQSRPVFHGCDYILSFLGERGTRSRFVGCRQVRGVEEAMPRCPAGHPYPAMFRGKYWYDLEHVGGFETLVNRVVIDWGKGTRSWVQRLSPERPKAVIEVLPVGHVGDFPGFDDVVLSFDALSRIVRNPDANRTWHLMLGSVAGVYLITDTKRGEQYIGSAYGEGGVLARWRAYVRTGGHGGNERIRKLIETGSLRSADLQFAVLRTLPLSMTPNEVIAVECVYKRKLGTRAYGLNAN